MKEARAGETGTAHSAEERCGLVDGARIRFMAPSPLPVVNALSVDLEDWYHVCGAGAVEDPARWDAYESRVARNTDRLLSILRAHHIRATFFILGYIAEREPALIRAVAREGHEIATHGQFHRRVFELSPAEFEEDLVRSMHAIATASGAVVVGYRAPEWSMRPHTMWALSVLRRNGILYDSSMVPLTRMGDPSFPRFPCWFCTAYGEMAEFPLTTARCFGESIPFTGGLPLRLTPYFYLASKIRRLNMAGRPALVYVHPWEFDLEQPRIDLPWSRRFMHYFNLSSTPGKLAGILKHLRFAPIREVLVV